MHISSVFRVLYVCARNLCITWIWLFSCFGVAEFVNDERVHICTRPHENSIWLISVFQYSFGAQMSASSDNPNPESHLVEQDAAALSSGVEGMSRCWGRTLLLSRAWFVVCEVLK